QPGEPGDHVVVDGEAGQPPHGGGQEVGPAEGQGVVELAPAVTGDLDPAVAGEAEERALAGGRVHAEQVDGVGPGVEQVFVGTGGGADHEHEDEPAGHR